MSKRFSCALVTGASSGLGAGFARKLAFLCEKLILVARREDRLNILAGELRQSVPGLSLFVFICDLSSEESRLTLLRQVEEQGLCPDLLINNAGLGDYGEFFASSWEKTSAMLSVDIAALTHLTHALLPGIRKAKGGIINLSSLAAVLPIPDFAVYAAAKAYVSSFSEALRLEEKEHGVSVLAVCPGPVATEFGQVARREGFTRDFFPARNAFYTDQDTVVNEAVASLLKGRPVLYPGFKVRLASLLIRMTPMRLIRAIMSARPRKVA